MRTTAARHYWHAFLLAVFSILLGSVALPAGAVQRTFVHSSPLGNDANNALSPPCTQAAPCRTFAGAIGVTDPGGEIVLLDTAGYGGLTITKSIKILAPGVYGGITVGGPNPNTGIVINAADTDDITLRGLDISGLASGTPALIGIDIQNAGAVHIEKSTISGFPEDGGACIQLITAKTVRVYVDDSFLRHCLTGIYANGTAVSAKRSRVLVDNTRIERGFNTNPASSAIGVWLRGYVGVSLRNTAISSETTAVQFDANLAGASSTLDVINSEFSNNTNGVYLSATAGGANSQIKVTGSQVINTTNDAFNLANSGIGRNVALTISGTRIQDLANAVTLANSAADVNTRMYVNVDNSQAINVTNAIDLSTSNGAKAYAVVRDSTLADLGTGIKTRGSSVVSASLIRSQVDNCTIVVDHGFGVVRLETNHIIKCTDGFVNNGSANIVSNGENLVHDIDNLSGFTYITPTVIPLQ